MKDEEHENVKGNSPSSGGVESKRTGRSEKNVFQRKNTDLCLGRRQDKPSAV